MRDVRHIRERVEVRLERVQVIWLSLGVMVAMGAFFALGVVVGRREARIEPSPPPVDPIAEVDAEHQIHAFYTQLTQENEPIADAPPSSAALTPSPTTQPRSVMADKDSKTRPIAKAIVKPSIEPSEAMLRHALAEGPPGTGDYTVQVSSFPHEDEAEAYAAALKRKGFQPFVVPGEIPNRGTWYRVRMGRFISQEHAEAAKRLLAHADIPAWVLRSQ